MSTFDKVRDITVEHLSVDADEVKMESSFRACGGADRTDRQRACDRAGFCRLFQKCGKVHQHY